MIQVILLLLLPLACFGNLNLFGYDLNFFSIPGKNKRTMICCHGYGGNYKIAHALQKLNLIDSTLISFNFPDHDIQDETTDPAKVTFGTINELLPALYTLKKYVIDQKLTSVDLYGYSAGGGVVINLLATLNSSTFDKELQRIGLGKKEKELLLQAIQQGVIVLDTPFKSAEEIIDLRGSNPALAAIAKRYRENRLRPIDSLEKLKGLSLDIILHFQHPDETIFNRDDALYAQRLLEANAKGTTTVIIGNDGGHSAPHWSLWNFYAKRLKT